METESGNGSEKENGHHCEHIISGTYTYSASQVVSKDCRSRMSLVDYSVNE